MTVPTASNPIAPVDEGLGNTFYLVDLGDGRALVVDPARDPAPYLAAARECDPEVAFAAETHLHADFVSGSRELAAGAELSASAGGPSEFPHRDLEEEEDVDLGGLALRELATPGHTRSTSATCCSTAYGRRRSCRAGRCWWTRWRVPTWSLPTRRTSWRARP